MIEVFTPKRIPLIVPSKAARDQQNVQLWLGSVQFDSAVCCTPQSFDSVVGWDAHRGA